MVRRAAFVKSLLAEWIVAASVPGLALSQNLAPDLPSDAPSFNLPIPDDQAIGAFVKVLCSAVFVSGRQADEAMRDSASYWIPAQARPFVSDVRIERNPPGASAKLRDAQRRARYTEGQGCVLLAAGDKMFFEPVDLPTRPSGSKAREWPLGDSEPEGPAPAVDREGLEAAADAAFADERAHTAAFLAVYKGRIVVERYAEGIRRDMPLESWSMGKSLTATLVALLIRQGDFSVQDLAPIQQWRKEGDPRAAIRIADLLHMSGGLHFTAHRDPDLDRNSYPDHFLIYTAGIDAFEFSITRPSQFPPGAEGRYRNCDPLSLGYIVRETVRKKGQNYLSFPQRELFDAIGMRHMVLETDPYGNFLLTGFDYGSARDWARLGLLYLRDGVWQGKRLLPDGWTKFVSTPADAWKQPVYGGLFWLNRTGALSLPKDAYYMAGAGGQYTIIVPSLDLVVVRMGHLRGTPRAQRSLNDALQLLVGALTRGQDGGSRGS